MVCSVISRRAKSCFVCDLASLARDHGSWSLAALVKDSLQHFRGDARWSSKNIGHQSPSLSSLKRHTHKKEDQSAHLFLHGLLNDWLQQHGVLSMQFLTDG